MNTKFYPLLTAVLILLGIGLTSCEKHDGEHYFKWFCKAELNGKSLIDQTRIEQAFNPNSPMATPYLCKESENYCKFYTELGENRGAQPEYYIDVWLPVKDLQGIVGKEFAFKKEIPENFDPAEPGNSGAYFKWLRENGHCFATVDKNLTTEYVENGTFKIESFDSSGPFYHGSFTLTFSEGTLTGHFKVGAN